MNMRFKKTEKRTVDANEDIGTAYLVVRVRKEIAAGTPLIPKAIVDRIANGENALRVLRDWRDVTQLYLSFQDKYRPGLSLRSGERTEKGHNGGAKEDCGSARRAARSPGLFQIARVDTVFGPRRAAAIRAAPAAAP